jgi:uncharacterized membrane protein
MSKGSNTTLGLFMGLVVLVSLYELARMFHFLPGKLSTAEAMTLHLLPLLVFALIHGAMLYGLRGILIFFVLYLVLGNIFENVGVVTGFPLGRYYYTDALGPKVFHVPILVGLSYIGMGYLSWILGGVILGNVRSPLFGWRIITLPLLAAFIMIAWDVANDPVWVHLDRLWVWLDGGAYFGVPLTNFPGLFLMYYLAHQAFAIYVRGRTSRAASLPASYWRWGIIFYTACAVGGAIFVLSKRTAAVVFDTTGRPWNVGIFTSVSALICIFVMGTFAALAWWRLAAETIAKR